MPTSTPRKSRKVKRSQWKDRYGELRMLIKRPELSTSGLFARVHYHDAEYIYNAHARRFIAASYPDAIHLQNKSMYNLYLREALNPDGTREVVYTDALQEAPIVKVIAEKLLAPRKEAMRETINPGASRTYGGHHGLDPSGALEEQLNRDYTVEYERIHEEAFVRASNRVRSARLAYVPATVWVEEAFGTSIEQLRRSTNG